MRHTDDVSIGSSPNVSPANGAIEQDKLRCDLPPNRTVADLPRYYRDQSTKEIESARKAVRRLAKIANGEDLFEIDQLPIRFAPSPVLRSEAELFGQSGPRFAVRVYLKGDRGSFVNLRRVAELAKRLKDTPMVVLCEADLRSHEDNYAALPPAACVTSKFNFDQTGQTVADALLEPSDGLREEYHVLVVDLGYEYGEGMVIRGTPFMVPLSGIGGGKCAQAAIFMASSLLLPFTEPTPATRLNNRVHGPSEVSAFAAVTDECGIPLKGLTVWEIARYFRRTGRQCLIQSTARILEDFLPRSNQDLFRVALTAYLRSNIPVILPVCSKILWRQQTASPGIDHAVTAVGIDKQTYTAAEAGERPLGQTRILINDPAFQPFMPYTVDELCDAMEASEEDGDPNQGKRIYCVPLPKEVCVSLETMRSLSLPGAKRIGRARFALGIFDLIELLQSENDLNSNRSVRYSRGEPFDSHSSGEFVLVRLDSGEDVNKALERTVILKDVARDDELLEFWQNLQSKYHSHWVYVQYQRGTLPAAANARIWVWDAETPIELEPWWRTDKSDVDDSLPDESYFARAEKQVLSLLETRDGGVWKDLAQERRVTVSEKSPSGTASAHPIGLTRDLRVMPITSYATDGTGPALKALRTAALSKDEIEVDLFAFMHGDEILAPLMPTNRRDRYFAKVVSALAGASDQQLKDMAQSIADVCEEQGIRIGAISTYFPEISSANPTLARAGVEALKAIVGVARMLREKRHLVRSVEVVCGSSMRGIGITQSKKGKEILVAARFEPEKLLDTVAQRFIDVVNSTGLKSGEFTIGVELEPGPLNAVNSIRPLKGLMRRLAASDAGSVVGVNLDVAHFELAEVDPLTHRTDDEFRKLIFDRIVHAHISDHGSGVFGDVPLTRRDHRDPLRTDAWMADWLQLVEDRARAKTGLPFSGAVSLEIESARCLHLVTESHRRLTDPSGKG